MVVLGIAAVVIGNVSYLLCLPAIIQLPFLGQFLFGRNDKEILKVSIGPLLPSFVPLGFCDSKDRPNVSIAKVQAAADVEEQGGIGVVQVSGQHGQGAVRA